MSNNSYHDSSNAEPMPKITIMQWGKAIECEGKGGSRHQLLKPHLFLDPNA